MYAFSAPPFCRRRINHCYLQGNPPSPPSGNGRSGLPPLPLLSSSALKSAPSKLKAAHNKNVSPDTHHQKTEEVNIKPTCSNSPIGTVTLVAT